jgi:hypothetical protein
MNCRLARSADDGAVAMPGSYLGIFVRNVVLDDQMNIQLLENMVIEMLQACQKFPMMMPRLGLSDHFAGDDVQCRGAMAEVVVRIPSL